MDPCQQPGDWRGTQRTGVLGLELRVGGRQYHHLRIGQDGDPALERRGLGLSPAALGGDPMARERDLPGYTEVNSGLYRGEGFTLGLAT